MKLVQDWKQAWRWISVNCMAAATIMQATWMAIPDDLRTSMPHNIVHIITILLLVFGLAGRMIKQGGDNANPPS